MEPVTETRPLLAPRYYSSRRLNQRQAEPVDVMKLPCKRLAFVYKRLSTHEQERDHIFSVKMQDGLRDMAIKDGYPAALIHIEERDIGISGTLGSEERPGLAFLIELIEQGRVESVYVVHTSRLYRDQTLIDGFAFGELCKKHGVVVITPTMRLNLRDDMHMRVYRMELEWAAQELKMIKERMAGARSFKGRQGFYAGGPLPIGYILDTDKESPTFEKIIPYAPHARVVKYIFKKAYEYRCRIMQILREAQKDGIYFPFFPPELAETMNPRTGLRKSAKHSQGWPITYTMVRSVLANPIYIGWWMWKGEIVNRKNHPPLLEEDLFWAVQEMIRSKVTKTWSKTEVTLLGGLVFCGKHDPDHQRSAPIYGSRANHKYSCASEYKFGGGTRACFSLSSYMLDLPIGSFIAAECSFTRYLDQVLEHLNNTYEQEKERISVRKREQDRLIAEIDNLKSHLAITRSSEQASLVLEEIEKRINQKKDLEREPIVITRVMAAADVENVKQFLSNMRLKWNEIPDSLKNEFLSIVLSGIWVHDEEDSLRVEVHWATGLIQKLWIKRPYSKHDEGHFWSKKDDRRLGANFGTKKISELKAMFPGRTWIALVHRAKKLGLRRKRMGNEDHRNWGPWTAEQDDVVRQYYAGEIDVHEAVELAGRTRAAIHDRAYKKLGLVMPLEHYRIRQRVQWGIEDDGMDGEIESQLREVLEQGNTAFSKFCSSAKYRLYQKCRMPRRGVKYRYPNSGH